METIGAVTESQRATMAHAPELGIGLGAIFETHVFTTDLERGMHFYGTTLGLQLAYVVESRRIAFYWIGGPGAAMLGVWEVAPKAWQRSHFAFTIHEDQIEAALQDLRDSGIASVDFFGEPTDDPSVHAWMPAVGIFFRDPDGNSLELVAMLSDPPRPDLSVVPLSDWRRLADGRGDD